MSKSRELILFTLVIFAVLTLAANAIAGSGDMKVSGNLAVGGSLTVANVPINPQSKNILRVSKGGRGDYATINAALSSITDNDFHNHYLIKVAPGRYNEKITMKPYVDIEGSGINQTWIESDGGSTGINAATVVGAINAELRLLTVGSHASWADPDNAFALGILHHTEGMFLLTDVEIDAAHATGGDCTGIYIRNGQYRITADRILIKSTCGDTAKSYGIYTNGNIRLNNSRIRATSTGSKSSTALYSAGTTATHNKTEIWNSELTGYISGGGTGIARGIDNSDGDITMRHSLVDAGVTDPDSAAIYNNGGDTDLATSQIIGNIKNISGTLRCVYLYDNAFNEVTCP